MIKDTHVKPLQDQTSLNTMGARIDYIRVKLEYPENQLARLLGSRKETVVSICSGKTEPTLTFLKNLIASLPVSESWVFMGGPKEDAFVESIEDHIYNEDIGLSKNKEYTTEDYIARFKFIRSRTELTQSQFAVQVGVSRDVISAIENGRQTAPLYVIKALATKYDVNLHWLITGEGTPYFNVSQEDIDRQKAIKDLKDKLQQLETPNI